MRTTIACLMIAAIPAWAADAPKNPPPAMAAAPCAECGVVRSVRAITKEIKPDKAKDDTRPSGLVATIPLDGGKSHAGSSARIGKESVPKTERWEVVVRYDDGRLRVLTLEEQPDVREGDRVRVEANGKLVPSDQRQALPTTK